MRLIPFLLLGGRSLRKDKNKEKNIDKTLSRLSSNGNAPTYFFALLLLLFFLAIRLVTIVSRSDAAFGFADMKVPMSTLTGVFSSVSHMCIFCIVVLYGKVGYFTSLGLLLLQFPMQLNNIFVNHSPSTIPGVFLNLMTIVVMTLLYRNNVRINKYQERLRNQVVTDTLTRLPNRFACTELVNDLVKRGGKFALVSIDFNNFKSINDTFGHEIGNDVLREIARRLRTAADSGSTGTHDFVTRQGGDEFSLVIRDYSSEDQLLDSIRFYEKELARPMSITDCELYMTASFGYTEFPTDADNTDMLFTCADAAMYEVKRTNSSTNRIRRFTPDLMNNTERTLDIECKLRLALENETVFFNLQPQFDMEHRLRGFEALARMKDTDGSMISPGEFIPVAEKVGLIDKVDICVLKNSARFFSEILKKTGADITLSVNISVRHLMKTDFLAELKASIEECGLPASQLEIEITESIMIESADKALQCINDLKAMGIKIAIDDFGTGYSSLSYLNSFPADLLKIDKSFIDKMNTGDSAKQYVAAIISIGHIMNFGVISEGVEDMEQLETLRSIGCDFIQGYIWGRPLDPEAAEKLVLTQKQ